MEHALLVAVGGAIGSVLRYLISGWAVGWFGADFPYGTLIANTAGAFIIGFVQAVGTESVLIPDDVRLFLTTGMMGGLTTYSAFSYETVRLMEANAWPAAWVNILVTTTMCLALCFLGIAAGRHVLSYRG